MGRRKSKNTVLRGGHMAIPFSVWDCDAFRDCDATSRVVFIEISDASMVITMEKYH